MTHAQQGTELRFEPPGPGSWNQDPVHFPRPATHYWMEMHPTPFRRGTSEFARAYGMLFALTHAELDRLYAAPGLEQYRPEAVLARPLEGPAMPALCYNLLEAPRLDERNPEYAARLQRALQKLDFPPEYVASVS